MDRPVPGKQQLVNSSIPLIYTRTHGPERMTLPGRALAGLLALACLGVLSIAAYVQPNAHGHGTHQQMGFTECDFLKRTNLPCPSCGMTTSFAYFVRGNIAASFYVQPMGTLLAFGTAACFWAATYVAATGRPAHRMLRVLPGQRLLMVLLGFAIAAWMWKMWIYVRGIDGWN